MHVGEALTGGDYHGLKASHLCILQRLSDGLVTIEGMLEHSKTKFKRYVNCLGTTRGKAALRLRYLSSRHSAGIGVRLA